MYIKKLIEAIEKKKKHFQVFQKGKQSEALLDADDPSKDFLEQLDKLAVYNPEFFPEGTTAKDDSLTSTELLMTDDAILCNVLDEEGSET